MTTIAELLKEKISTGRKAEAGKISKRQAATVLEVTRPTLDDWIAGTYVPNPWDHARRLAEFLSKDEDYITAMLLIQKGIDPRRFGGLATYAKGVWLTSPQSMVPAA